MGLPYDPEEARQELADAGYGPDKPVPPVELWYNREGNNEAIFKAVGAMLEEVGFPVRLVSSKWEVYRDALKRVQSRECATRSDRRRGERDQAACRQDTGCE